METVTIGWVNASSGGGAIWSREEPRGRPAYKLGRVGEQDARIEVCGPWAYCEGRPLVGTEIEFPSPARMVELRQQEDERRRKAHEAFEVFLAENRAYSAQWEAEREVEEAERLLEATARRSRSEGELVRSIWDDEPARPERVAPQDFWDALEAADSGGRQDHRRRVRVS